MAVLDVSVDAGIAIVTLNRPEARNALSPELAAAIPAAIVELDDRDDVACIVLTGTDPAFCAGFDLRELSSGDRKLGTSVEPTYTTALPPHRTPIIGAINGAAVTGGFELALACDFLIASDRARFADTHARVGVIPGWGLTVLLPEAIGIRRARYLSVTGAFISAATACEWGLVNEVVPHESLLDRARAIAAEVVALPRAAVREVNALYNEVSILPREDALVLERRRAREWIAARLVKSDLAARRDDIVRKGRELSGQAEKEPS
jgi:enoyl-CoA hydratase